MTEIAELRIRTWRKAIAVLSLGIGGMVFAEIMSKLNETQMPFSTSSLLFFFVSDLLIICFCHFQIRGIKKASAKNIEGSPSGANPAGKI